MGGASSMVGLQPFHRKMTFDQLLQTNADVRTAIKLIDFKDLQKLEHFPRYPENKNLTITLEQLTLEKYNKSLLVFISHCWLRGWPGAEGWDGRPHPDNAEGGKYRLCIDGIERIRRNLAPGMTDCYIWLDFGCIDQDGNPAGELKLLDKIVQVCDCIFSPLFDKFHDHWEYQSDGWRNVFREYQSQTWNGNNFSYLNRGWCRIEMFYAAHVPLLEDSEERRNRMAAGLKRQKEEGRRPHILYGSKEMINGVAPIVLPPLQNTYFDEFHPEKGHLTKESDRETIKKLVKQLKPYMKKTKEKYVGEYKDGTRDGKGKYIYPNGDVYEGEYKDGKRHGRGIYKETNGCFYEGEYKEGLKHGMGVYHYAHGEAYEGEWKDGKMDGHGVYKYANGEVYEGEWREGNRHGKGVYRYPTGDVYEGEYHNDRKHGVGSFREIDGGLYEGEWKDGEKHGKGKCRSANGNVYEGEFQRGKRHGKGIMRYANGDIYRGEWRDDRKSP